MMHISHNHNMLMKRFNAPRDEEGVEEAARLRASVNIETLVLMDYPKLEEQARCVRPSRFRGLWRDYKLIPERVLWLLPSPFRPAGDRSRSVLVLPKNGLWRDRKFHREGFPPDVIGFVMAYDSCRYAEAVDKLRGIAARVEDAERRSATADIQMEVLEKALAALKN